MLEEYGQPVQHSQYLSRLYEIHPFTISQAMEEVKKGAWDEQNTALSKMAGYHGWIKIQMTLCIGSWKSVWAEIGIRQRLACVWVSFIPALHKRPDSPGVPRVRGRFRRETQCKNAKVNKEWLLLRDQRRERARKDVRGGERDWWVWFSRWQLW